jgi:hypothetical protein
MKPHMIEAVRLKERLTQKAYWSESARYSPVKYLIQRMIMQDLGKPVEQIIPAVKPRNAEGVDPQVKKAFGIEVRPEPPLPKPAPAAPAAQSQTPPRPDKEEHAADGQPAAEQGDHAAEDTADDEAAETDTEQAATESPEADTEGT